MENNSIERISPKTPEWEMYYGNHISRYKFALEQIKRLGFELNILDIACGVGYGTKFLSDFLPNSNLVGVDISSEAISIAKSEFNSTNVRYIEADCMNSSLYSIESKFDIVISFETFEHLKDPDTFLKNVYSELKIVGVLIVSTPNKHVSSPDQLNWDFHEVEYTPLELRDKLQNASFTNLSFFGQSTSELDKVINNIKNEFDKLSFNPLIRLGKFIKKVTGREIKKSKILDSSLFYSIQEEDVQYLESLGSFGPDVTIVVCKK